MNDTEQTLSDRLQAIADGIRARGSSPFAATIDDFVARLEGANAGSAAPQVGEKMPPFDLPDQDGRLVSLDELLTQGPLVIAFHRGHWCPYCRTNMIGLAEIQDKVAPAQIVAISPETRKYTGELRALSGARFPFLTDVGVGYCLSVNLAVFVDQAMAALIEGSGKDVPTYQGGTPWIIPIPAVFVLDRDGTIVARYVNPDYRRRMESNDILAHLQPLLDRS
jgi:peroxiredoxin